MCNFGELTWIFEFLSIGIMDLYLGIDELFKYLEATPNSRCINEGQAVLNAGHIVMCGIRNKWTQKVKLFALCLKSSGLHDSMHEINAVFKYNEECVVSVEEVTCTCKAGLSSRCKHVAAVLYLCTRQSILDFEELSCTDVEAYWKKEKSKILENYNPTPLVNMDCVSKIPPVRNCHSLEQVLVPAEKQVDILHRLCTATPYSALTKHRKRKRNRGIEMSDTLEEEDDVDLKAIFETAEKSSVVKGLSKMVPSRKCCQKMYNSIVRRNCLEISKKTLDDKLLWKYERKFRITGSRCYDLFSYKGDDWHTKSMKYFWPKGFTNKFTRYGIDTESEARASYALRNSYHVKQTGVVICEEQPWLAYSPDGVVIKNGVPVKLLEIKCPFIGKTEPAINFIRECKYLVIDNDRLTIRKKHAYYCQIQLGMAILNIRECDLVLYSSFSKDFLNIVIEHDENFTNMMLQRLQRIYFDNMLHEICLNEK